MISGSNVIANVQDTFNIDGSDWIQRAANWINKALADIGVTSELPIQVKEVQAEEYKVELPCDIKSLEAVEVDGYRIYRTRSIISPHEDNKYADYHIVTYKVLGDNYIEFETGNEYFRDVTVKIHFKSFQYEIFKPYDIKVPLVPDLEIVQDAIAAYIMIKILGRGYKHPVFSLNNNNPATNPYLMYYGVTGKSGLRKKARLKIKGMDKDERERVSVSARSFNHPDRYFTKDFNNKY
jgi:hypothetical protein